ncbi:hypothetical protein Q4S45_20645 [Massilia sp. R2A-15]|uniref:hypothetical protein n=1 Tax=Massilia sp. R2A-15 TaxID=3064278 RepID=UPI0027346DD7|nr:hypothetical protein [Massilia sp. R2A-15]WLI89082.1 hypothetical protein Q4S45_20645 [Massilia sp. R2A-15]
MPLTGPFADAVYLSLGRAILRKQERAERTISDHEALGHAQVLQGHYGFVKDEDSAKFGQKVLHAFRYVEQENLPLSSLAAASYGKDKVLNRTPLHDDVIDAKLDEDLGAAGFST